MDRRAESAFEHLRVIRFVLTTSFFIYRVLSLTSLVLGLRPQRLSNPTWRVGYEWLQRSWCSVLGPPDRRCANDASRSQKLGHFRRTMSYWKPLRHGQWRYESENLELRSLYRGETIKSALWVSRLVSWPFAFLIPTFSVCRGFWHAATLICVCVCVWR